MFRKFFYIITLLMYPYISISAEDGRLGSTSTGTINISLSLNTVMQITKIEDVILSYAPGIDVGDLEYEVDLCIYTNHSSGSYKILQKGINGTSTTNRVKHQSVNTHLPYEIHWFTNPNASGPIAHTFTSGVVSPSFRGAHTSSNTCNGGAENTASVKFKFNRSDLLATPSGNYSDVVTLTVSPI